MEMVTSSVSEIYRNYTKSQNIGYIDTSDISDSSHDNVTKKLNSVISNIMENVSSNDAEGISIRNTARLFSYIINGIDPDEDEPEFENINDAACLWI